MWALRDAGRDLYTAARDALTLVHPDATDILLCDVAPDGSRVRVDGALLDVPSPARPSVARMRTSRLLSGCLLHEPLVGIFDAEPGVDSRRVKRV